MRRLFSPSLDKLSPYVPGEQLDAPGLVKLNTNENPYPPAPAALDAIRAAANEDLRLYPTPDSAALCDTIARHYGLASEQVFVGNGSDEVLAHAFNAFFRQSEPLLFPDLTYSFYPVYCDLYAIEYRQVPLDEHYCIQVADYRQPNGGIIFPNPNAPTGIGLGRAALESLLRDNRDSVVLVDEAYIDFAVASDSDPDRVVSAVDLVDRYDNLLVVQTLSKSRSLAGLRLGYALGSAPLVDALNRVKNCFNSYPVDRLAQHAAQASFSDQAYFEQQCQRIIDNRQQLVEQLQALGFDCLPSQANFVLASHARLPAASIASDLRERQILVRYFNKPRLDNYLRISVGSETQVEQLVAALRDICSVEH